ncbi:cytochrome-c peroxidase [Gemmatimonas groenlandica]|uniref:C-type cytochrome n=1 Tax=Gemmatimonas groenlandica TaxID=2732249 RepID=A0A6M4ISV7_9BACT|nr:cytochrome c peroxidase [Gemmatimonas groenlandica]QJR37864.1 c-type cytochrome [Gemmatimonas groenlandica]
MRSTSERTPRVGLRRLLGGLPSRPIATLMGVAAWTLLLTMVPDAIAGPASRWTAGQREVLRSLSIASLAPLPADPSNVYGDNQRAAALGHRLFFEPRLSGNDRVSCATCHSPTRDFQDAKPLADGVGRTARRTMPVAGTAYSPWLFWDGRADSQWAQALGPLESAVEHGGTRTRYAHVIAESFRAEYAALFGALPDLSGLPRNAGPVADTVWGAAWGRMPSSRRDAVSRVYANIGKAIAAYERTINYAPSRFDYFVDAELARRPHTTRSAFSKDEIAGLQLFIGKGNCVNCHNGALFTDSHFHNTGVAASREVAGPDSGRAVGVHQALTGEFNCASRYSDAKPDACDELRFAVTDGDELLRAYKTPSLRNVAARAPYMHAGQVTSLTAVVEHYDHAPQAPFGTTELRPLRLSATERRQLVAFLQTLTGPLSAPADFLQPPATRR